MLVVTLALVLVGVICLVVFRAKLAEWWAPAQNCVAVGTRIATPGGDIAVEHLQPGDSVLSVNIDTGSGEVALVTSVLRARSPCMQLETASGLRLVVTASHPLYAPEEGRYLLAERWLQPDPPNVAVLRKALTEDRIIACRRLPGMRTVFDITVDSAHHNFLANGILVHNKLPAERAVPREPTRDGPDAGG